MAQDDHARKTTAAAKPAAAPRADLKQIWHRLIDRRETLDRQAFFHIGAWGCAGVATLALAFWLAQSPLAARRQAHGQTAELIQRQALQVQQAVRDAHNENRRLAAALDVLNADRDRLFARVTALETDLASVTGSVARAAAQTAPAPAPVPPSPLLVLAGIPSPLPGLPLTESPRSLPAQTAPPAAAEQAPVVARPVPHQQAALPAAEKPDSTPAAVPDTRTDAPAKDSPPEEPAARTLFGVDLGSASSVDGLRALWGGVQKAHGEALDGLRPIIVLKERSGGQGLQLRLVAGPVPNAAAAAKLCAGFLAAERSCETAVYEGQRLVLPSDKPARVRARPAARPRPAAAVSSFFPIR
jgi:hypothetical protein